MVWDVGRRRQAVLLDCSCDAESDTSAVEHAQEVFRRRGFATKSHCVEDCRAVEQVLEEFVDEFRRRQEQAACCETCVLYCFGAGVVAEGGLQVAGSDAMLLNVQALFVEALDQTSTHGGHAFIVLLDGHLTNATHADTDTDRDTDSLATEFSRLSATGECTSATLPAAQPCRQRNLLLCAYTSIRASASEQLPGKAYTLASMPKAVGPSGRVASSGRTYLHRVISSLPCTGEFLSFVFFTLDTLELGGSAGHARGIRSNSWRGAHSSGRSRPLETTIEEGSVPCPATPGESVGVPDDCASVAGISSFELSPRLPWQAYAKRKERRFAIVLANSDYDGEDRLTCPTFDARRMHEELSWRDFQTDVHLNLSDAGIAHKLSHFVEAFRARQQAEDSTPETLLLYFSGHGVAENEKPRAVGCNGGLVNVHKLFVRALCTASRATHRRHSHSIIALMDACLLSFADNVSVTRSQSECSIPCAPGPSALASPPEPPTGGDLVVCAYACLPGQSAFEADKERCSVWTSSLLEGMAASDDILKAIEHASASSLVQEFKQQPWVKVIPGDHICSISRRGSGPERPTSFPSVTPSRTNSLHGQDLPPPPTHGQLRPSPTASPAERRRHIHCQLDAFIASTNQTGMEPIVLEDLKLLSCAPFSRCDGGQAVVQLAESTGDGCKYALKFFVHEASFQHESSFIRTFISGHEDKDSWLPGVQAIVDSRRDAVVDVLGRPLGLPSCIALQWGTSLLSIMESTQPQKIFALVVMLAAAEALCALHDAGYVHRDFKPAHFIQLQQDLRWALIDFGCVAATGDVVLPACTAHYAAPEVAVALRTKRRIVADPAQDAWSLGVVAYELLTGTPWTGWPSPRQQEVADATAPWEGPVTAEMQARMGLLKRPVLSLLHRDPSQRATVASFAQYCSKMLESDTEILEGLPECTDSIHGMDEVSDVGTLCAFLCAQPEGQVVGGDKDVQLSMTTTNPGAQATWATSSIWARKSQAVGDQCVQGTAYELQRSFGNTAVCCWSGAQKTLQDVSIDMRDDLREQCLLLDASCTDCIIRNVAFTAGSIVLRGSGCSVHMTNVSFTDCTLLVLEGAAAMLESCHFRASVARSCDLSLLAHGPGTSVVAVDVCVNAALHGAYVCAGAFLRADRVSCTGAYVCGVQVAGPGTRAVLHRCKVADSGTPGEEAALGGTQGRCSAGIAFWDGSDGAVVDTAVLCNTTGLLVSGARVTATGCSFSEGVQCVAFAAGATGRLLNCQLRHAKLLHGLQVSDEDTAVTATSCELIGNAQCGAGVHKGGHLEMRQCSASGNGGAGFWARAGGRLLLHECRSERDCVGFGAFGTSSVVDAAHCKVHCSTSDGVNVGDGASAGLLSCEVLRSRRSCVVVRSRGTMVARECCLKDAQGQRGLTVTDGNTRCEMHDSFVCRNKEVGAGVFAGALLIMSGCEADGNGHAGFWAESGGRLEVTHCQSSADAIGCGASDSATAVLVERLQVRGSRGSGVLVTDKATCTLLGSTVSDCSSSCVEVGGGARASVKSCTMLNSRTLCGVLVHGSGTCVHVEDSIMAGNKYCGASVVASGLLDMQNCRTHANGAAGFNGQGPAYLTLTDCSSKKDKFGCLAYGHGCTVMATSVRARLSTVAGFRVMQRGFLDMQWCAAVSCGGYGLRCTGRGSRLRWMGGKIEGSELYGALVEDCAVVDMKAVTTGFNQLGDFASDEQGAQLFHDQQGSRDNEHT